MNIKKVAGLVCIVIFATFGSLIVTEMGFRLIGFPKVDLLPPGSGELLSQQKKASPLFVPSTDRIYKLALNNDKDNYWRTDSDGFRFNPNHTTGLLSTYTRKILLIGDSYTYGQGVTHEEAYPAQLEKNLIASKINVRVNNAGVPGYSPDQEFVYLRELLRTDPYDVIVWNFSINDVSDDNNACLYRKTPLGMMQIPGWLNTFFLKLSYSQSTDAIITHSYTINYLIASLRGLAGSERFTFGCSKRAFAGDELLTGFEDKMNYFQDSLDEYFKKRDLHTKLVFVLTPFRGDARTRLDPQQNNDVAFEGRVDQFLKTRGIPYLNASSVIVAATQEKRLASASGTENVGISTDDQSTTFFLDEKQYGDYSHLNSAGNALFAHIVSKWLLESGVI